MIFGTVRRKNAGVEDEILHLKHSEIFAFVPANPWLEGLRGDAAGAGNGNVRMKGFQVGLQSPMQDGVLDVFAQCEEMRMPGADSDPHDGWTPVRAEKSDALERKKERRHVHVPEAVVQPGLSFWGNIPEKAEREMEL